MRILLVCNHRDPKPWVEAFVAQNPDLTIDVYPEVKHKDEIEFAISWQHEHGIFNEFPNLKVIASMGAGVYHIIGDQALPKNIEVTRIVDQNLTDDMANFVLLNALYGIRNFKFHQVNQDHKNWEIKTYQQPEEVNVGLLGYGVLGHAAGKKLQLNGFRVSSCSKTRKHVKGVKSYIESELDQFLSKAQILVCLLPITEDTIGILNKENLKKLPRGAQLINVARGQHLVEADLLEMLNEEQLSLACLDVFNTEPLPKDSKLWSHQRVLVTPHVASMTDPDAVVNQILDNYERMKKGQKLNNKVDRQKSY